MAVALADLGAREVGVVAAKVYRQALGAGGCACELLRSAERAGVVGVSTGQSVEVVLFMPHKPDLVASLSGKADRPIARIVVVHFDGLGWHRQADAVGTVIAMQTYASTFPREEGKKADTPKRESDVFC